MKYYMSDLEERRRREIRNLKMLSLGAEQEMRVLEAFLSALDYESSVRNCTCRDCGSPVTAWAKAALVESDLSEEDVTEALDRARNRYYDRLPKRVSTI